MKTWMVRLGWMALGVAGLYGTAALAEVALGGPLDPPGTVSSTMQTIDSIPPAWFRALSASDGGDACTSSRFVCVLGNDEAVLDRETGLVWWRDAEESSGTWDGEATWCAHGDWGRRKGWRLPTVPELMSLIDTLETDPNRTTPAFPPGHPFTVQLGYWTWTTEKFSSGERVAVDTRTGLTNFQTPGIVGAFAMCVRDNDARAYG